MVGDLYGKSEDFKKLAERMAKCSGVLAFKELIDRDSGEVGLKLDHASFCHVRNCPVCQWRRGLRNTARFYEALPAIQAAQPKAGWIFLTLTVRNPEMADLRATLKDMNRAWQRLIERADWPGEGFIRTTEITRGRDGKPHPHFHALVLVKPSYFKGGNYLSQARWTDHWKSALRADYTPIVNVKRVKATSEKAKAAEAAGDKQAALGAAVLETLKYAVKPSDLIADAAFLYGITKQLHKCRFLATGGLLKGVLKEQATDDEMTDTGAADEKAEGEEADRPPVFFGWRPERMRYRKTNNPAQVAAAKQPQPAARDEEAQPFAVAPAYDEAQRAEAEQAFRNELAKTPKQFARMLAKQEAMREPTQEEIDAKELAKAEDDVRKAKNLVEACTEVWGTNSRIEQKHLAEMEAELLRVQLRIASRNQPQPPKRREGQARL